MAFKILSSNLTLLAVLASLGSGGVLAEEHKYGNVRGGGGGSGGGVEGSMAQGSGKNQVQDIGAAEPRRLNIFNSDGVSASGLNKKEKGQRKEDKKGQNKNKGKGQGNVVDQLISQMAKQLEDDQQSGKPIDVNELRGMVDQIKSAVTVDPKKKEMKEVTKKVLARKMKNGEFPSKKDLVFEMLADIQNEDLRNEIISDVENGFAIPDASAIIDPRAGENEDRLDEDEAITDPQAGVNEDGEDEDEGSDDRRLGVTYGNNIWPGGVIKITFVMIGHWYPMFIRAFLAMAEIENLTTLSFQLVGIVTSYGDIKNDGTSYLRVSNGCYCCTTGIGAPSSTSHQEIHVSPTCTHGSMLHELLHSAGMMHQQTASYRDKYVTVNWENIENTSNAVYQFTKLPTHGYEFVYDYGSIMHYGQYGFSKNGKKTIDCHGNRCGQRSGLSIWDQYEIIGYYMGYYYENPWL